MNRKQIMTLFCCAFFILLFLCCIKLITNKRVDISDTSIFSWEEYFMEEEYEYQVQQVMKKLKCKAIYQYISDTEDKVVLSFLKRRARAGQKVYYLDGAASWGIEDDTLSMLQAVKKVIDWNKKAEPGTEFSGIVFDIEPYLLQEWDNYSEECMEKYVFNCKIAYEYANQNNLLVILCIPNFYDSIGYTAYLRDLTEFGCDALAVMNYDKTDEAEQIKTELTLAKAYDKGIISIVEMQKPGYHNLTNENTYYYNGLSGAENSWKALKSVYSYSGLGFSWHYLKPVIELLEAEKE